MKVYKGTIVGFQGSWMSGIASLLIKHGRDGGIEAISCDNAPTVRSLDACFGNVIDGFSFNPQAVVGKTLVYCVDAFGVLAWFVPLKDWELSKNIPSEGRDFKELDEKIEAPKGEQLSLVPGEVA